LHVSPRLGFNYNRSGQVRNTTIGSNLGRFSGTTPGVLRGGIGEFRSFTPANLLSTALVSTGLPGSLARVSCIGGDGPPPNWNAFAASASAIPTTCTTGSNSFADAAPNVVAFDRDWETPRSWRANLAWQSVFQRVTYSVEGIYSLNLNQPGTSDLNFANAPR